MARAANRPVNVWTANEPDDWERLLRFGVNDILTDHPERLKVWLAQRAG